MTRICMSRVDFFRDLGLDVETAVVLDDELSTLPARTQRVFEMRAAGYTQSDIANAIGITQQSVSLRIETLRKARLQLVFE